MDNKLKVVGGVGLGAGLLLLLDPAVGRRRLRRVRDRMASLASTSEEALEKGSRDLRNRARGTWAQARARMSEDGPVPDGVLEARVRSKLGHYASHPSAIEVRAERGRVVLTGPILADEADDVLAVVSSVRGVEAVDNRLEVHNEPGDVPGLQGESERTRERFELLQDHWSPAARLLVGAAGGGLALYGATRRDRLGAALGSLGLGLLVRGLTDQPVRRIAGLDREKGVSEVQKAIHVNAPVEKVFGLWADYGNFPRFLSHVREVRDLGDGRSHWVVEGPAGIPVEWDSVLTRFEREREVAWRTARGADVMHHGRVLFTPDAEGGTRVEVRLSYTPPAGPLGQAVATLFGVEPERQIDEDLIRMKTYIETGRPARHTAEHS
jgi:uncharacterized membrane protein